MDTFILNDKEFELELVGNKFRIIGLSIFQFLHIINNSPNVKLNFDGDIVNLIRVTRKIISNPIFLGDGLSAAEIRDRRLAEEKLRAELSRDINKFEAVHHDLYELSNDEIRIKITRGVDLYHEIYLSYGLKSGQDPYAALYLELL